MGEAGYAPISPDSGFSGGGGTVCAKLKILVSINKKIYILLLNKRLIISKSCVLVNNFFDHNFSFFRNCLYNKYALRLIIYRNNIICAS